MIKNATAGFAAALAVGSLFLPWVAGSGDIETYSGAGMPLGRWVLFAVVATHLVGTALMIAGRTVRGVTVAVVCDVTTATAGFLILEVAPGLLPGGVVLRTVRRSVLDVGAGVGPWVMLAAAVLLLASRFIPGDCSLQAVLPRMWLGIAGAVVVEIMLVDLRRYPWASVTAGPETFALAGRELPWLGPLSLVLSLSFAVTAAMYFIFGTWSPLLVPAAIAWFAATGAGTVVAVSHGLEAIPVEIKQAIPDEIQEVIPIDIDDVTLVIGGGHIAPFLYVIACVLVAALVIMMIATAERSEW